MRRLLLIGIGVVAFSLLGFGLANAQSFRTGDNVTISGQETVNQTLFAAGRNIDVAANINGDVFCAGQNIIISGDVSGDVICAGQNITINGAVDGDVRLAGQTVTINATVADNATVAAQSMTVVTNGEVGGDLSAAGDTLIVNGSVGRDLASAAANLEINSRVGRNVTATGETITLETNADIRGDVDYTSRNMINQAEGATVAGSITQTEPPPREADTDYGSVVGFSAEAAIYAFLAAVFTAFVLTAFFPHAFNAVTANAVNRPLLTAGVGLAFLIGGPILLVGLLMTVVGIPLAILVFIAWLLILALSGSFAGYYLGRLLLPGTKNPLWLILGGVSLLMLSYFVPVLGALTFLAALVMGSGMLVLSLFNRTPRPTYSVATTRQSAP